MDKKIFKNYIYNILYQVVKIVLPFFLVPYTMSTLGESVLGISDYAGNIASWFVLFGILGINIYGNREIAKVRDDKDKLSTTFFEILVVQLINMSIALVLYILYTKFFVTQNQLIFYLHCLTLLTSAFDITWFYFGVENFKIVSIRNTIIKILSVGLIFLLVKKPEDLWLFVVINAGSDLLGQLITYFGLKKYIDFKKVSIIEAYKHHLKATFILFVPTIAINVYTLLDQTMLGTMIEDKGQVALYKAAQSFVKMFLYFITAIGSVVMPRIANLFAKDKNSLEVNRFINSTFHLAIVLGLPMMAGMICVSPYFFPWYLPGQPEMVQLVQISSPIILFIAISNVFGTQYLVPTNRNAKYTISVISGAVVNFGVNLLLIPKLAGIGAAIGSVIAEFTVTFVQWMFVRKEIHLHGLLSILKSLLGAGLMCVVVILIGKYMGARIITNIIQAVAGAAVYIGTLAITKEATFMNAAHKLLKKGNDVKEINN